MEMCGNGMILTPSLKRFLRPMQLSLVCRSILELSPGRCVLLWNGCSSPISCTVTPVNSFSKKDQNGFFLHDERLGTTDERVRIFPACGFKCAHSSRIFGYCESLFSFETLSLKTMIGLCSVISIPKRRKRRGTQFFLMTCRRAI